MMNRFSFPLWSLNLTLCTFLAACSPEPKRPSIELLASDAHVIVGGVPLTVPFVALSGLVTKKPSFSFDKEGDRRASLERLEAFRRATSNQDSAPVMDTLEIRVTTYGWDDFDASMKKICPVLTRQWAKSVCDNPWAPLQQAFPNNGIYLADVRKLAALDTRTVGGERRSDQLRQMHFENGAASVVCDIKALSNNERYCTAAILIGEHLAAVWTVWDSAGETPFRQAEREGKTIMAFVLNALGPNENFPALLSAACQLKNPAAPRGPFAIPCSGTN